jgi:hypothetical protein
LELKVLEFKGFFLIWINFHFVSSNSHLNAIEMELGAIYANEFPRRNITCVGSLGSQRQKNSKGFFSVHKKSLWG